jgi:predicted RNA-binding Zn-ribbon protein involved in translation (DUF1610 family)
MTVNNILTAYAEMQSKGHYPCPRCGSDTMSDKVTRNALSRRVQIYVCDQCGTQEALEAFRKAEPPISSWWIINKILANEPL